MVLLGMLSLCRASEHKAPEVDKSRIMVGFTVMGIVPAVVGWIRKGTEIIVPLRDAAQPWLGRFRSGTTDFCALVLDHTASL